MKAYSQLVWFPELISNSEPLGRWKIHNLYHVYSPGDLFNALVDDLLIVMYVGRSEDLLQMHYVVTNYVPNQDLSDSMDELFELHDYT